MYHVGIDWLSAWTAITSTTQHSSNYQYQWFSSFRLIVDRTHLKWIVHNNKSIFCIINQELQSKQSHWVNAVGYEAQYQPPKYSEVEAQSSRKWMKMETPKYSTNNPKLFCKSHFITGYFQIFTANVHWLQILVVRSPITNNPHHFRPRKKNHINK